MFAAKQFAQNAVLRSTQYCAIWTKTSQLQIQGVRPIHGPTTLYQKVTKVSAENPSSPVFNVQDEDDFKTRVLNSKTPVIVDFHATWCGPCKLLGPRLEALVSARKGIITMAKVDIDENSELAEQYNVRSVPTVISIKNGKVVEQMVGLADDDRITGLIDKVLN